MTIENITMLKTETDEALAQVERIKRGLAAVESLAVPLANARWAHYDASIEAGFDPDQALEFALQIDI